MSVAWWVRFRDRDPGCVETMKKPHTAVQAMELAGKFGDPVTASRLPYPAGPRLGETSDCPSFCYEPSKCVGWGACPQQKACSE